MFKMCTVEFYTGYNFFQEIECGSLKVQMRNEFEVWLNLLFSRTVTQKSTSIGNANGNLLTSNERNSKKKSRKKYKIKQRNRN